MPTVVILGCVAALLGTSLSALVLAGGKTATRLVYMTCLIATLVTLATVLVHFIGDATGDTSVWLPLGVPWIGAHFRLDALSDFFLIVVSLGGVAASLYGLDYGRHESEPGRVLPFYPAFLAGMTLVVLADDAFTFLLCWEFMSLTSWALVISHPRDPDHTRAGYVYLVMASFGTLALLLVFGLLAGPEGHYDFAAIRNGFHGPLLGGLVLGLTLLGAGSKAGLVPLHVWLPLAHPAAPSHVSALMSGVMTKVAVYGFIRIVFDLLGAPSWWWSMVVLGLGGVTAVAGVLYALMQHDLKRLLAYHTVENIGIIFIGLGLALAFRANGMTSAAALALTAALFHVFNHSLFKSLLFFGAGAVLTATGERDMECLGGLIHRMPVTAFAFLAGSMAISALPPLNGFVSEWLTFQAVLLSPEVPQWGLRIMVPMVGAMLALSAALAAACFVKAFGVTFLGRPRSAVAETAREVSPLSLAVMLIFAALCLLAGIFPGLVIDAMAPVTQLLVASRMPVQTDVPWLSIVPIGEARSSYNGLLVCLFITLSASLVAFAIHRLASRAVRRGPAWDCGFPVPTPATQYTATSFAQPIRRVFGALIFRTRIRADMPPPGEPAPAHFIVHTDDLVWDFIYTPVVTFIGFVAGRLNGLQYLTIQHYLGLVFFALIALLTVLVLWL